MREKEIRGLMEAYSSVYEPQELTEDKVWEEVENWVNSLVEEGYDLSEYTWEEMYENYLSEMGQTRTTGQSSAVAWKPTPGAGSAGGSGSGGRRGSGSSPGGIPSVPRVPSMQQMVQKGRENEKFNTAFGRSAEQLLGKPGQRPATPAARPAAPAPAARPAAAPAARPAAAPAARPAATAPTKPTTAAPKQTGDKAKDMSTWAKANPKLAAAAAERARTRGTSSTTNPLMKDMKSRLPAAAPSPAAQAAKAARGPAASGPKSTTTPKPAPAATSTAAKPTPAAAPSTPKPTPAAAPSTPKPNLQQSIRNRRLNMDLDLFDLVKGYLLGEGYADSEEGAMVIMVNMSEGWRESILESCGVELDEAQRARENPEDHDKEEKKKYEPVRGEKTPMPPRGDKRREDFEKWYAKNVR